MGADPSELLALAAEARRRGRHRRSIELCNTALNRGARGAQAVAVRLERAAAGIDALDLAGAERDCRLALADEPSALGFRLLARCLFGLRRVDEAAAAIEAALAADPESSDACLLAARIYLEQGQRQAALDAARNAEQRAQTAEARAVLLDALAASGHNDELIDIVEQQLAATPSDARLWTRLGMSLYSLGRSEEAVTALRQAIALDPAAVDAHCGLGWVLLRLGQLEEGLLHHEYRLRNAGVERRFGVAPWRGEPLAGKHIVVCAEQGFGDTIQFARFVPALRELGSRTTFIVPPALGRLFRGTPALGEIETGQPAFGGADYQTLLMSLPHLLKLGPDVTLGLPVLQPEPERVAHWRARLPPGPRIAIAWQGNPKYGGEPWRSMPCSCFAPLVARFGASTSVLSLQKHVGREQLAAASFAGAVLDLGDEIDGGGDAFVDSIAILSLVDHFITTDSALAHVAGSAGIPASVLLSHAADWRWGTAEERTPWYPCLRLFRQTSPGDWSGVIQRLLTELEPTLHAPSQAAGQGGSARHSGSKSMAECSMPPHVVGTGA